MGTYCGCAIIDESTVGVVEYLGKYDRIIYPGCNFINCFLESVSHRPSLRLESTNVQIETVTSESLSITVTIGIQYQIDCGNISVNRNDDVSIELSERDEKSGLLKNTKRVSYQNPSVPMPSYADSIYKATYSTRDPLAQISQFINSYFRTISCNHTMKELFNSKNKLANELELYLNKEMNKYGYVIHRALIIDIDPPAQVKQTMNLVLESQNKRDAMVNAAKAEKETMILKAEGLAETRRLEGEGLALQRRALADGLKHSVTHLCGKEAELDPNELTKTIITMQYIDMLNQAAANKGNTFIMQCYPTGGTGLEEQVRSALLSVKDTPKDV